MCISIFNHCHCPVLAPASELLGFTTGFMDFPFILTASSVTALHGILAVIAWIHFFLSA